MRHGWRDDAACVGHDPGVSFPIGETGPAAAQVLDAKRVCSRCTVREPCLEWAIRTGITDGIFGGLDEHERRGLRVRRHRQPLTSPVVVKQAPDAARQASTDL